MLFVGSRLGLYTHEGRSLSGEQIEQADIEHLRKIINDVTIFYRTTPKNKLKIVKVITLKQIYMYFKNLMI